MVIAFQVSLTTTPRRLSELVPTIPSVGPAEVSKDIPCRTITLQTTGAAAYVGMDDTVSGSNYGLAVDDAEARPVVLGAYDTGGLKPGDLWVVGESGSAVLHVLLIGF